MYNKNSFYPIKVNPILTSRKIIYINKDHLKFVADNKNSLTTDYLIFYTLYNI